MKKKTKSRLKNRFSLPFWSVILLCLAGAAANSYFFYNNFFRALSKFNEEPIATITFKYKTAQRKFLDRVIWDRLRQDSPVYNGDTIHTAALSEATIWFTDGNVMELSENTMAQVFLSENALLRADITDGRATVDTSESASGMKIVSGGIEVAVESGSTLSAEAAAEDTSYGTASAENAGKSGKEKKQIALQVIKGSASVTTQDNKTVVVQEGKGLSIEGTTQKSPSIVIKEPAPGAKILYNAKGNAEVQFKWNKNEAFQDKEIILEFSGTKNFKEISYTDRTKDNDGIKILLPPGTYYWRAKDADGKIYSQNKMQLIQSMPPEPLSPAEKYSYTYRTQTPAVRLIWTESQYAASYKLEIADNPNFTSPAVVQRSSLTSSIISTLGEGTYYWRVTPFYTINRAGFLAPSRTNSFKIEKKGSLQAPVLLIPEEKGLVNTEDTGRGISFSWKQDSEAEKYNIRIADNSDFKKPIIDEYVYDNYFVINTKKQKLPEGKLYWNVALLDTEGTRSDTSETRIFYAMKGKPEQHTIQPTEGFRCAETLMPDTKFTWKRNLPETFTSEFQISKDTDFKEIIYKEKTNGTSSKGLHLSPGTYYWHIKSESSADGTVLTTPPKTLTVLDNLPAAEMITPLNGEKAVARETTPYTFRWKSVDEADSYKFSIYKQTDNTAVFEETVFGATEISVDMYSPKEFTDKTNYKWQVQAQSSAVPGIASRRTGKLAETSFYLAKLRPVEITYPKRGQKIDGKEAIINPIKAKWFAVDKVKKAQFVLKKTDENPVQEILRIPSDSRIKTGASMIAPSEITLDTAEGLRAGKYEIIVYAETLDGIDITNREAKNIGRFTVTPIPPLEQAVNLKAEPAEFNIEYLKIPANPRTITLSWNKVPDATDYFITIQNKRGKTILEENIKQGTKYSIDFSKISDEDKATFSKGTFKWTVQGIGRIDTDGDKIPDKILQYGKVGESYFTTDIPTPKKTTATGASNPYGSK